MALNQQAILAKYQSGVSNGAANYRLGVTGAGTTWQTNAASDAAEAAYAAGVARAAQAKSRQREVAKVTGAAWEQAAINVGATQYANSAQKAAQNYQAQIGNIITAAQAGMQAAGATPRGTISNNLTRARDNAIAIHRTWAQIKGEQPQV